MIALSVALIACVITSASAQETAIRSQAEQPVSLTQKAVTMDANGREALAASLLTSAPQGTPEAPLKNVRFVLENRGAAFYTYVSGTITFYKDGGTRCGEGSFALNALAPGEAAEMDAPGLRLECTPSSWRVVAINLLTRTSDAAKPAETETQQPPPPLPPSTPSPLYVTVDGQQYQIPLNSTLDVPVRRRRIKITVSDQP